MAEDKLSLVATEALMIELLFAVALAGSPVPDPERVKAYREYLNNHLADYPGSRFKDVHMTSTGNFCGDINPKNAMGGYSGWSGFFLITTQPAREIVFMAEDRQGEGCKPMQAHVVPGDFTAVLAP